MNIYYEDIKVGTITTNQSVTIAHALDIIGFNEKKFICENGMECLDYNDFKFKTKIRLEKE